MNSTEHPTHPPLAERVAWLAAVIRTPAESVREGHPLAVTTRERLPDGTMRTLITMPDKVAAAAELCALLGWNHPDDPLGA